MGWVVMALMPSGVDAQDGSDAPASELHHAHLNSVDPEAAIAW